MLSRRHCRSEISWSSFHDDSTQYSVLSQSENVIQKAVFVSVERGGIQSMLAIAFEKQNVRSELQYRV